MSVIYFSDKQLDIIHENISRLINRSDSCIDMSKEKLCGFIIRVGICNRLAYEYNYLEDDKRTISIDIPDLHESEDSEMSLKELIKNLDLLDYNCVTNSGRCFLDSQDKRELYKLINSLRLRYIDSLEKDQPKGA